MRRILTAGVLIPALVLGLSLPASALFGRKQEPPVVEDISKNGLIGSTIPFSEEDFVLKGGKGTLSAVVVETLPDPGAGTLLLAGTALEEGGRVERSALSGLRFHSSGSPTVMETGFTLRPVFTDGREGESFAVTVILLTRENHPPVARNMDLATYKNVSLTGYFDAVDAEGDTLTYRMLTTPARGAVTLAEDGSGKFVYRPYENKTGRDTFTYVALDGAGNRSEKATVTIRIEKGETAVTYAELDGHPAHKSAVTLAEEGIYVGPCVAGEYLFEAERQVTRAEFLAMAMKAAGIEPLEDVSVTGFADDSAIPAWSKGSVSAALLMGAVQGGRDEKGAAVFLPDEGITAAQAAVMLDGLLQITDVPLEVFGPTMQGHWAGQAAADLAVCGIMRVEDTTADALEEKLTLGDAAILLDGAVEMR